MSHLTCCLSFNFISVTLMFNFNFQSLIYVNDRQDGKVTEDEFVAAVLKHQKTALMLTMKIVQV
jgi:hypothetical protein